MMIIGAGLSGLIAATQFPRSKVIEARSGPAQHHHALLRFRSDAIGIAVRIPFRKVRVSKAVWADQRLHSRADIRMQNAYSLKVSGKMLSRSIDNLDTVERWVAPADFYSMLEDTVHSRIEYGTAINALHTEASVISTIPMFELAKITGYEETMRGLAFNYSSIHVKRFTIPDADVYQTVYYPESDTGIYRASITGNLLIVESMDEIHSFSINNIVLPSFGINAYEALDDTVQRFGKIAPIDEAVRQAFIMKMSLDHRIYSLGRFATWRNILLDDVLQDIERIREINSMTTYHKVLKGVMK